MLAIGLFNEELPRVIEVAALSWRPSRALQSRVWLSNSKWRQLMSDQVTLQCMHQQRPVSHTWRHIIIKDAAGNTFGLAGVR